MYVINVDKYIYIYIGNSDKAQKRLVPNSGDCIFVFLEAK
jgi:hypothetical protein